MKSRFAISTSNETSALDISLLLANVDPNSEVITQSLNFIADCNAITYCIASPVFVDVDKNTMSLSPTSFTAFLKKNTKVKNNKSINKIIGKIIKECALIAK